MTRDDWLQAEAVLTDVLPLSTDEQKRILETVFLHAAIRRELLDVLQRTKFALPATAPATAGHSSEVSTGPRDSTAAAAGPLLAANDTVADGRFRIVRQLGRGGMGEVYLASDTKLETLVALKVLLEAPGREAQHARRCSGHPHIVTMHDVLETRLRDRSVTVLVMEHLTGRPANRVIDDGRVPIPQAVRWARQVAAALAHAHDCDVLHCDLKPANILMTEAGAKVVDFGIGRSTFDAPGTAERLRGTLPYMAPEQLTERQFSRAGDIYALGVTLFELITGRLPFEGDGPELILRIIGAPPPAMRDFRPDVPPELDDLVARAIAKRPGERYRSARAFEAALQEFEESYSKGGGGTGRIDLSRRIVYGLAGVAAAAILVTFAGLLASASFNAALHRTAAFSGESARDWPRWGIHALLATVIITSMVAIALAGISSLCRFVGGWPRFQNACGAVQTRAGRQLRSIAPTLTARARWLLALQLGFLIVFGWYFQDIFKGLDAFTGHHSPAQMAALAPANRTRHMWFDLLLSLHLWVFGAAWLTVLRGQANTRAWRLAIGGLTTTAVALLIGQVVPFRIIYHNHGERAIYRSEVCYIVGERGPDALLFCPFQEAPWTRIVRFDDPALYREGIVENIFMEVQRRTSRGELR